MKEYYNNCPYVCYSRAIGFKSKEPVPTCKRFHSNTKDPNLIGTFERCCDIAISGRCLIDGAKEIEQNKIDLLGEEHKYNAYCKVQQLDEYKSQKNLKKFLKYIYKLWIKKKFLK